MKKFSTIEKSDAVRAVSSLLSDWGKVVQVIFFRSNTLRYKATKRSNQNEILLTIGKPSYSEKELLKKAKKQHKEFKFPAIFSRLPKKIKK